MLRLALLLSLSLPSAALAHDEWANGDPVPAWVKQSCCGPADAHRLDEADVQRVPGGYRVKGYNDLVPDAKVLPSQDSHYWVFYATYPDGSQSMVYCMFVPMSF